MLSNPVRLEDEPQRFSPPPRLGEHTRQILAEELGFTPTQIGNALANGSVRDEGTSP
jgi:crotonobetainyl-CoA:carnitine CoA-transferase CaiB-like acyl-CoA transferase